MITITVMKNSVTKQILGTNIRRLRNAKGWTQAELSRRTGIDVKSVSRYENGLSFPSADLIDKIAAAFGVQVCALFEIEKSEEEPAQDDFNSLSKDIIEKHGTIFIQNVTKDMQNLFEKIENTDRTR